MEGHEMIGKTFLVGLREFRQRVRSRGFLLSSLAMPIFLLILFGVNRVPGGSDVGPVESMPVSGDVSGVTGLVDQANLIQTIPHTIPPASLRTFADIAPATEALARGEIEAYYVILPDYRETGNVRRVSRGTPAGFTNPAWLNSLLVGNLSPDLPPEEVARLRRPFHSPTLSFVNLAVEESNAPQRSGTDWLPFLIPVIVMSPLFTSGSYLFQSLVQEKSNRVMEVLLLSLRPRQLLLGKLLGLGALTVVQYAIWAAVTLLVLTLTGTRPGTLLEGSQLALSEIGWVIVFALGGYILYATLMAGIGALAPNVENSRGWIFMISLPMLIPLYLWTAIASAPNGSLAVILSFIPFSTPVTMLMRMTATTVPPWQIVASVIVLYGAGAGLVWLMARLFHAQTLLSGESISLRRMWAALAD
jgi:ABC-2 type transport system permease protein